MRAQYTHFTPIPPQVPRQLAIELLQNHGEIITLNPLVLDYHPIKAPRDCPNDEYYSTWYEINERIQFVPGLKKMGSSKVTFKGCFHDMPWGVQTHMYIPLGVDLRNKWIIKGNQPGEPPEPRELGSGAPASGLYLREEVDVKCNPLAVSFVKKEMKASAQVMVERMIKKAELLEAGILHAMFENGKLKTFNPADKTQDMPGTAVPISPGPFSPTQVGHWKTAPHDGDERMSTYLASPHAHIHPAFREAPNPLGQISQPGGKGIAVEMPGDFLYPSESANQNRFPSDRYSQISGSDYTPDKRTSRYSFVSSDRQSEAGGSQAPVNASSPNPGSKQFTAELAGSGHKDVEAKENSSQLPQQQQTYAHQAYNPQNYAKFAGNGYT